MGEALQKELEAMEAELAPLLLEAGFHLLELKSGGDDILRLVVHREPAVTHEDCGKVARLVSAWSGKRAEGDPLTRFMLEVSSPGLTRTLARFSEAALFTGRTLRVTLRQEVDGGKEYTGTIAGAADGVLRLVLEDGKELSLAEGVIRKMKLSL